MTSSIKKIVCSFLILSSMISVPKMAHAKDPQPPQKQPTAYIAIEENKCEEAGLFTNFITNKRFCDTATNAAAKAMGKYSFTSKKGCEDHTGFFCAAYPQENGLSFIQLLDHRSELQPGKPGLFKPIPHGIVIPDTEILDAKSAKPYFRGIDGVWKLQDGREINIPDKPQNRWENRFSRGKHRLA